MDNEITPDQDRRTNKMRRVSDKQPLYRPYEVLIRVLLPSLTMFYGWLDFVYPKLLQIEVASPLDLNLVTGSLWASSILCALLLGDVVANDVLPRRYHFRYARIFRELIWMAAGLIQIVYASLLLKESTTVLLGCIFLMQGAGSICIAFLEVWKQKANR